MAALAACIGRAPALLAHTVGDGERMALKGRGAAFWVLADKSVYRENLTCFLNALASLDRQP